MANSKIAETRGGWFMLSSNLCSWYKVPVKKWGVIPTSAVRKTAWGWIFVDIMPAHQNKKFANRISSCCVHIYFLEVVGKSDPIKSDSPVNLPKCWFQKNSIFGTPNVIMLLTALPVPAKSLEKATINLYHSAFISSATANVEIDWG